MVVSRLFTRRRQPKPSDTIALEPYMADLAIADALRDNRACAAAADRYRRAIELGADDLSIRKQLANMLKDSGQFAAAEAEYRLCAAARPDDADVFVQLGHLFKLSKQPSDAIQAFATAVEKNPDDAEARAELLALQSETNEGRLSVLESEQQALHRELEEIRRIIDNTPRAEEQMEAKEIRSKWDTFIPLMIQMSSTIARVGADLQALTERTERELRELRRGISQVQPEVVKNEHTNGMVAPADASNDQLPELSSKDRS
jgi:tetratricopeptide (TPR) repeat protein